MKPSAFELGRSKPSPAMEMTTFSIRQAISEDEDVLWQMLYEAAHMADAKA
ncbi:MAG: hypothetical protein ACREJU_17245 [Nitrospiraceae bacterium]